MGKWRRLAVPGCLLLSLIASPSAAQNRGPATPSTPPNIVLMFPDNLGIGEVGIYGGNRGVPTPRLDALAREGMRLTNFNTEYFCTPSRAAILTGRHGVRSGTNGNHPRWGGLTQWEMYGVSPVVLACASLLDSGMPYHSSKP